MVHHVVDDLPALIVRSLRGVDDMVLDVSSRPIRDGGVRESDVVRNLLLVCASLALSFRSAPLPRVYYFRLVAHKLECLLLRLAEVVPPFSCSAEPPRLSC